MTEKKLSEVTEYIELQRKWAEEEMLKYAKDAVKEAERRLEQIKGWTAAMEDPKHEWSKESVARTIQTAMEETFRFEKRGIESAMEDWKKATVQLNTLAMLNN